MRKYFLYTLIWLSPFHAFSGLANHSTSSQKQSIEFEYSKEEIQALGKWKDKNLTFEQLFMDALQGDAAALYNVGMCYLLGMQDFTIDVGAANTFFAASASLGFAPALDKLKMKYIYDDLNPFLCFVYTNLTISAGHREFTLTYHDLRNQFAEKYGIGVLKKIEEIALKKKCAIFENIKKLTRLSV